LAIIYFYTVSSVSFDPSRDYPLGTSRPELVRTPGGIALDELELHGERVEAPELRATPDTLRMQAEVARSSGRKQLADNLLRAAELAPLPDETILEIYTALRPRRSSAAELAPLPDETILEIYTALRPGRSTAAELEAWAVRLDDGEAPATAAFVREAAQVYARRGLLAA
jgi:propanediol dehydratase small subunit